MKNVLVWDLPVRVFHWLLAASFAGAWLTAGHERWMLVHLTLGCTVLALAVLRVAWGLVGTRHARFGDFVRGPRAAMRYLGGLVRGQPQHYPGHNPVGGLAIVALLALAVTAAAAGLATYTLGDAYDEVHEVLANLMLGLVGLHVAAVVVSGWLHRENLVAAMFSGRKRAAAADAIATPRRGLGIVLLAAVLGFWGWQLSHPAAGLGAVAAAEAHGEHGEDGDD
ncbi:cytochrome b/b6 domain-containing protein [Massilia sp.]|uniref:cytochrome b/b6 domain-containing protein n=1 Tax=Massilia sp. TaxID=1882437 RepID=UPI00352CF69C